MIKELKILPGWNSGTGIGESDLKVSFLEMYDNSYEFESSAVIGISGDLEEQASQIEYRQHIDVRINPGYFYIHDREFYCYNEKITQLSYGSLDENYNIRIPLLELPNGAGTINYVNFLNSEYTNRSDDEFGTPPILVKYFNSGELEEIGVPVDIKISSRDGIGFDLGYRMEGETVLSGDFEISGEPYYPSYFTPIDRFSICPQYWVDNHCLQYDQYSYDFITNEIIIYSGDPSLSYLIEYENLNIPFRSEVELNPLYTAVSDKVLVLNSISQGVNNVAHNIKLSISNIFTNRDPIIISAFVTDSHDNPCIDTNVNVSIRELSMLKNSQPVYGHERTSYMFIESGPMYDLIHVDTEDTLEFNGVRSVVTAYNKTDDNFIIPSCGVILPGNERPDKWIDYNNSPITNPASRNISTNDQGYINFTYYPPALIRSDSTIRVYATADEITGYIDINLTSIYAQGQSPSNRSINSTYDYTPAASVLSGDMAIVNLPYNVIYPTDVIAYNYDEFMINQWAGGSTNSEPTFDVNLYMSGDEVLIQSSFNINNDLMLRYGRIIPATGLDQRSMYV